MGDLLVSVIISTYGRTDFLQNAIESVIAQTYKNIEIIIVDDNANKPDIRDAVISLIKNYPQCVLVQNVTNLGGALARNEGIKVARGELISFLDDDDSYMENRIEKYVQAYSVHKREEIGVIYSFVDAVDINGNILTEYKINPEENYLFQHMCGCLAATSQWIIPKIVFEKVGCFEDTPCKQDSIMLLKILGAGFKPLCVEEILGHYTEHSNGRISGVSEKKIIGTNNYRDWCRKYYSQLTHHEVQIVESTFASQLLSFHILLNQKEKAKKELKIIANNNLFSMDFVKSLVKYLASNSYRKKIGYK